MFLCSGAEPPNPRRRVFCGGTRENKAFGAVFRYCTCASGPREHACGSRQLRKFSTCPQDRSRQRRRQVGFGAPECQVPRPGCRLFQLQRVLFAPAERHDSHRRVLADTRVDAERCGLANEPPSAPLSMTNGSWRPIGHSREDWSPPSSLTRGRGRCAFSARSRPYYSAGAQPSPCAALRPSRCWSCCR